MKPAIVTFAASGAETAARLAPLVGADVHHCGYNGEDGKLLLPRLFAEGRPIVGVCAAGILIRLLAPSLGDKQSEPPVLAVSQDGTQVVSLLGGHHGANRLAREIAAHLGGSAALTTASDAKFTRGLDEPPPGYVLADPAAAKPAMMALLIGGRLVVDGHAPWLAEAGYPVSSAGTVKIRIDEHATRRERELLYHPRTLVAGIGAERGVAADEVIGLIAETLAAHDLAPQALAALTTIDIKSDEAAFHAAAAHFAVPLRIFTAAELNQERYRLLNPSPIVEAETGTPGVAEAAALKAGSLLVEKRKSQRATCAIGRAKAPIDPLSLGRAPGLLHVVGIGPGDRASRSAAAVAALDAATDWVGYDLYLDLVADLRLGQEEHRFPLGDEEARVRHALELAATGKTVALVCSGDAQIYAMASLVFELIEAVGARKVSESARRVAVDIHPGISAFQAASAAAGALIGHDFACVSLSDLLTPSDTIRQRLAAAASGDFVTALYNPRSQRRTDLIEHARTLFLAHRPPETPVIVASSLGRPAEQVTVTTLAAFDPTTVDMLTIVLIGASTSRAVKRGDGKTIAFTPRGYHVKAGI
ncbi:MAG: precorrin-3B C(17)-methyltransferase [Devosia sp.]|uniref:precorrin-3B C(17)-methyltransferase n=1 Tax=Devosia sp. 66-22 TaxID=1895753 RepID=UPI00092B3FF5|nr:precorrin-3B C(17)-methyltransferase [Devosia sp. 66-22]MBN9346128.1 precorrin-3B C(17)-methyltransferase [Devosia sp.]OJX49290.1 MAG: precorrin-3B C(17)-methyltransferase [Devosia sp. 66-22]